jgi:CRP-like cAMP-binding protein
VLSDGGCFGDISIVSGEPNEFSYFYDNHSEIPLQLLSIDAEEFREILDEYPLAMRTFQEQTRRRTE